MENMTAKMSCFARAYHQAHSAVRVFDDTAAGPLLGADCDRIAQSLAEGIAFFLPGFHGGAEEGLRRVVEGCIAPSVLGRSAYCERMLALERRLGCRQYALFAAGYDTFALRSRDAGLAVFELDLPDVLADKRRRAEAAGLARRAVDVPCDLSEASWPEALTRGGFRRGQKAFASLLGLCYYLPKEAFRALLTAWGEMIGEGSALCFDYPLAEDGPHAQRIRALARGAGEGMRASYAEGEMEALLADCGFLLYEHLMPAEMTAQYFSAYNKNNPARPMEAPRGVCYAYAVKKQGSVAPGPLTARR